ncbi:hypothetical protein CLG96_06825 [Sphingomonas oleivorans]|uniref:Uncharacterized protein n=1 Tax=Sphingomonas oleivorans TaxID=1735121 RepID=A0A2T5FZX2_9SPHN|nr:hypothetical protein [Sphingomonas oleivorans]PTQ12252.1 hypothetical protein CLG96_06825 [Sphingomonas oleivorans]
MDEINTIARAYMDGRLGALHAAAALRYFSATEDWPDDLIKALVNIHMVAGEADDQSLLVEDAEPQQPAPDENIRIAHSQTEEWARPVMAEACQIILEGGETD